MQLKAAQSVSDGAVRRTPERLGKQANSADVASLGSNLELVRAYAAKHSMAQRGGQSQSGIPWFGSC